MGLILGLGITVPALECWGTMGLPDVLLQRQSVTQLTGLHWPAGTQEQAAQALPSQS